jgi:acetyl-CoA C-acetyltransferase
MNMTDVIIAGIGQTEVGEHWDISLRRLAYAAIREALADSGGLRPQALFVANMLAPTLSNQAHLGALLADHCGLTGIEAVTVEAAGASGGAALRQGYLAVKSGFVDVALVVGVEKFTDQVGAGVETAIATTSDSDFEAVQGLTATGQAALLMRRYMHEFHVPAQGFAGFPVVAHANGAGNKFAMFRKAIKPEMYGKAEMVSDPINLFDVAPIADGAAAVILTRADLLPKDFPHPLMKIAASVSSIDTLALHDRQDPLAFLAAREAVQFALQKAGLLLEQVNFFEYHDSYSIYAALALESAGFAARGEGWKLAADGSIALKGRIPCATLGGLKARGFPGGATGVYQAVEAATQLRGAAGSCQVAGARFGMIQSLGGPASTSVVHILEKIA